MQDFLTADVDALSNERLARTLRCYYISSYNDLITVRELLRLLKALSDTQRLRILKMLEIRSLCVCEITEVLGLAQSTVSKHLAILRDVDLIVDTKDGKWVNYALNRAGGDRRRTDLMAMVARWLPDDETIRKDAARVDRVDREVLCKT